MELIEDQHTNLAEPRIILNPSQKDSLGNKGNPGRVTDPILEPHLVTHLCSKPNLPFPSHPSSHSSCRYPPRLQHDNLTPLRHEARIEDHLRHLSGLARSCGGDQDELIALGERADQVGMEPPDGKTIVRHSESGFRDENEVDHDGLHENRHTQKHP